jgi:hypothetical protein
MLTPSRLPSVMELDTGLAYTAIIELIGFAPAGAPHNIRLEVEPVVSGLIRQHEPALIPFRDVMIMPVLSLGYHRQG